MATPVFRHFQIQRSDCTHFTLFPKGRETWALVELVAAGNKGCTPSLNPAPRWSKDRQKILPLRGSIVDVLFKTQRTQPNVINDDGCRQNAANLSDIAQSWAA
ncbi:MAG: hypothetical protein WBO29_01720 [Albidovulum sp.]